jgi:L-threonylcarbamoyladenylate synthase
MNTILTTSTAAAARVIKAGGLAAFPTETVYGLGADIFNESAVGKIFPAKGRPADNPLIAHIGKTEQIGLLAGEITMSAQKFMTAFWPAPLTLVLPKAEKILFLVTAGLDTIGIRMPAHIQALEFLELCGTPVVAPSANLSGRPSPTTWQAVYEDLNGRIDCILQAEATEVGLESTVVDCTGDVPLVLRSGALTLEELQKIIPETRLAGNNSGAAPRSPGLKHKHYSPRAKVMLVGDISEAAAERQNAYIGLAASPEPGGFGLVKICQTVPEYAHSVFEFFRECDRREIAVIFCRTVAAKGLGLALMDRLDRAAQGVTVEIDAHS